MEVILQFFSLSVVTNYSICETVIRSRPKVRLVFLMLEA